MRPRLVHAHRLERWIGAECVEAMSRSMVGMRHPVPVGNIPGRVWCYDGEFYGKLVGGQAAGFADYLWDYIALLKNQRGGFTSLSDLINEVTVNAKKQAGFHFVKTGVAAPAIGASQTLWRLAQWPLAGANAAAAPGGTIPTNASTGSFLQKDAAGGDTLHLLNMFVSNSTTQSTVLMLYDYLFGVNINHATSSNSVTGVPTRYQTAAFAPGNFLSGNVTTALNATAHNITVTYVDQDGNTAEAGSAQAIRVSSAVDTTPFTQPKWMYLLNAADSGLRNVTNISFSAAPTGNVDWYIGHPLMLAPCPAIAFQGVYIDGLNQTFSLERIYDGACLALAELYKSATAAANLVGYVQMASG